MKATARRPAKKRQEAAPQHSHKSDITGVILIALAIVSALSLALVNTGVVGHAIGQGSSLLFGKGDWIVPLLLGFVGIAVITSTKTIVMSRFSGGLFVAYMALLGILAKAPQGDFLDPKAASSSGGYFGGVMAMCFHLVIGDARYVGFGALMMIGILMCVDQPIKSLIASLKAHSEDARERAADLKLARPKAPLAVVKMPERETVVAGVDYDEPPSKRQPIFREKAVEATPFASQSSTPKEGYQLPPISLLTETAPKPSRSKQEMQKNIERLEGTLEEFGIDANVVEVAAGPTVTRYEIQLGPGIRVSRIVQLADNIAMNLAASHVRVEAPIPGKAAIGVEVPNSAPMTVSLREVCETREFQDHPSRLAVSLGQDVSGQNKYADLTKMPHMLIGGATNSGKSIGLASIIMSLLVRNTPKDVRFVMIDPKRVELSLFDRIPHLMCPVIKDVKEAPGVLRALIREMDRRYDLFSESQVRNIDGWNAKASFQDKMPYIVVVIDELADLMITSAAEVETSICRLAQLARATGIHLVIATQRPSVDVITGTIKANIASRIAFTVSSQIDSRTILDQKGAESLIGRGDMLFMPIDASKPLRIQGCYVTEKEIEAVCSFWRAQEQPVFTLEPDQDAHDSAKEAGDFGDEVDPLWQDGVRWVSERGQASTSMLQRKFSIGFQRASRLLDQMEERGIVGPRDGPRPREVLVSVSEVNDLFTGGGKQKYQDTGWQEED